MPFFVSQGREMKFKTAKGGARRWCHESHGYFLNTSSATKIGTMRKISSYLHHLGGHGVPAVRAKWKRASQLFYKRHCRFSWKMAELGIVQDKF